MQKQKSIFVLGAAGFIGRTLVKQACAGGWRVSALVRSESHARLLSDWGATPVIGDLDNLSTWAPQLSGHDSLVDLIQPKLPRRLTRRKMRRISAQRVHFTRAVLTTLADLPAPTRPLWLSVSGCDDLQPDAMRRVHSSSALRSRTNSFSMIGIPVRHVIETAGADAAYVYLDLVYGPGKAFGELILPGVAQGRFPVIGRGEERVPLVHVQDAARALLHVAGLAREQIKGKQFVVSDGSQTTLNTLIHTAAQLLSAPRPKHIPRWLASLLSGEVSVSEILNNIYADPGTLLASGFSLSFPSLQDGLRATISELGLMPPPHSGEIKRTKPC